MYTTSLTFNKSTFCPHRVFRCFVWIWEQTAIISPYYINWLVFTVLNQFKQNALYRNPVHPFVPSVTQCQHINCSADFPSVRCRNSLHTVVNREWACWAECTDGRTFSREYGLSVPLLCYISSPIWWGRDLRVIRCLGKVGTEMSVLYVQALFNYVHLLLNRCQP